MKNALPLVANEGAFQHNHYVTLLADQFRSALLVVTYIAQNDPNYSRTDLLLVCSRPQVHSSSSVAVLSTGTGTSGENVEYSAQADGNLNVTVQAKVTRNNGSGGTFKVFGFITA